MKRSQACASASMVPNYCNDTNHAQPLSHSTTVTPVYCDFSFLGIRIPANSRYDVLFSHFQSDKEFWGIWLARHALSRHLLADLIPSAQPHWHQGWCTPCTRYFQLERWTMTHFLRSLFWLGNHHCLPKECHCLNCSNMPNT